MMHVQPFLFGPTWIEAKDGDDSVRAIFERHYSRHHYKDGRKPKLFVGPGGKMVLITPCTRAIFAWRRFHSRNGQKGVNCAIFRNEGAGRSSDLILAAEKLAWKRWPGERLYTYVDPHHVRSANPGYCFLMAGWQRCGVTKVHKRLIFEKFHPADTAQRSLDRASTPAGNSCGQPQAFYALPHAPLPPWRVGELPGALKGASGLFSPEGWGG